MHVLQFPAWLCLGKIPIGGEIWFTHLSIVGIILKRFILFKFIIFFKIYFGLYNTSLDIFYALSLFVIAIALRFFEFKNSFLFMGIFMLIFALISLGAKEVIEKKF